MSAGHFIYATQRADGNWTAYIEPDLRISWMGDNLETVLSRARDYVEALHAEQGRMVGNGSSQD